MSRVLQIGYLKPRLLYNQTPEENFKIPIRNPTNFFQTGPTLEGSCDRKS